MSTNKTVIVFLHYFGGDAGSWQWLVKKLNKKCISITLTLPGFGGTKTLNQISIADYSDWVIEQIELLELKNYILCGHSFGAKIALYTSKIKKNNKPKKIILIAPLPLNSKSIDAISFLNYKSYLNVGNYEKAVNILTQRELNTGKQNYAVQSQPKIHENVLNWFNSDEFQKDISLIITGNQVPIYVITSKKDPIVSPDVISQQVLPYINNAKLMTIARSGHLVPLESTRKLARFIKQIAKSKY